MTQGANTPPRIFPPCTVAQLPTSGNISLSQGDRGFVIDADSVTFNAAVVGESTNSVPVFWNGSAWKVGG